MPLFSSPAAILLRVPAAEQEEGKRGEKGKGKRTSRHVTQSGSLFVYVCEGKKAGDICD